jgi:hypothetical protein
MAKAEYKYGSLRVFMGALGNGEWGGWNEDKFIAKCLACQLLDSADPALGGEFVDAVPVTVTVFYERAEEETGLSASLTCKFTVIPAQGTLRGLVKRMQEIYPLGDRHYLWNASMEGGNAVFVYAGAV